MTDEKNTVNFYRELNALMDKYSDQCENDMQTKILISYLKECLELIEEDMVNSCRKRLEKAGF